MRVRIKFSKYGLMKYVGHLDVMRYFQKALRRAEIDVAYSEGFSPHMIMSFAAPLGVGITSDGEYFDLDLKSCDSSKVMLERINAQMIPDVKVTSLVKIPEDKANKCMSLVSGAAYKIIFQAPETLPDGWMEQFSEFMKKESIQVMRKTKRNESLTEIRPWIYSAVPSAEGIDLQLSAGSVNNLKPELVLQAFLEEYKQTADCSGFENYQIHRMELFADQGDVTKHVLIPLCEMGEIIE